MEISARIAKGRKRRLVSMCAALAAWLNPYRKSTGPVWSKSPDALEEALTALRDSVSVPARRNGFRHAFITYDWAWSRLSARASGVKRSDSGGMFIGATQVDPQSYVLAWARSAKRIDRIGMSYRLGSWAICRACSDLAYPR